MTNHSFSLQKQKFETYHPTLFCGENTVSAVIYWDIYLTDCGDKICKNGGTLNSRSCQSECQAKYLDFDYGKWKAKDEKEARASASF